MNPTKKKGFTLIELLVVIAIIGILATLAVVALQNARQSARDAKRIADITQMQTALELFYNDHGGYPDSISTSIASGGITYMSIVPTAPSPADGDCQVASNTYEYSQQGSGASYTIDFCLGNQTGGLSSGAKQAVPGGVLSSSGGGGNGGVTPPSCLNSNSGFETIVSNDQAVGWRLLGYDGQQNQFPDNKPRKSTSQQNSGAASLLFNGDSGSGYYSSLETIDNDFVLSDGVDYNLGFNHLGDGQMFMLVIRDESGDCFAPSSGWEQCTYDPSQMHISTGGSSWGSYSVDNIGGRGFGVGIMMLSVSNSLYVDDISLTPVGGGTDLFASNNNSFENWLSVPQGWSFSADVEDVIEIEQNSQNVYSGSYSVKISNPNGVIPTLSTSNPFSFSSSIDISFYSKANVIGDLYITLRSSDDEYYNIDNGTWSPAFSGKTFAIDTTDFSQQTISNITPPSSEDMYIYLNLDGSNTNTVWIDNFCIEYSN